nr:hypothetical protein VCHA53O474_30553 [Vibrio chagasii]
MGDLNAEVGITEAQTHSVMKWALSRHTGASSKTLAAAFFGFENDGSWPRDESDLGRCMLLVELNPFIRGGLDRIAPINPQWNAIVENWDALESLYHEGNTARMGSKLKSVLNAVNSNQKKDSSMFKETKVGCTENEDGWLMVTEPENGSAPTIGVYCGLDEKSNLCVPTKDGLSEVIKALTKAYDAMPDTPVPNSNYSEIQTRVYCTENECGWLMVTDNEDGLAPAIEVYSHLDRTGNVCVPTKSGLHSIIHALKSAYSAMPDSE